MSNRIPPVPSQEYRYTVRGDPATTDIRQTLRRKDQGHRESFTAAESNTIFVFSEKCRQKTEDVLVVDGCRWTKKRAFSGKDKHKSQGEESPLVLPDEPAGNRYRHSPFDIGPHLSENRNFCSQEQKKSYFPPIIGLHWRPSLAFKTIPYPKNDSRKIRTRSYIGYRRNM